MSEHLKLIKENAYMKLCIIQLIEELKDDGKTKVIKDYMVDVICGVYGNTLGDNKEDYWSRSFVYRCFCWHFPDALYIYYHKHNSIFPKLLLPRQAPRLYLVDAVERHLEVILHYLCNGGSGLYAQIYPY